MRKTFVVIAKSSSYSPTNHRMLMLVAEDGECWQVLCPFFDELQIGERLSVSLTPIYNQPIFEQFNLAHQERLPMPNPQIVAECFAIPDPNEALI